MYQRNKTQTSLSFSQQWRLFLKLITFYENILFSPYHSYSVIRTKEANTSGPTISICLKAHKPPDLLMPMCREFPTWSVEWVSVVMVPTSKTDDDVTLWWCSFEETQWGHRAPMVECLFEGSTNRCITHVRGYITDAVSEAVFTPSTCMRNGPQVRDDRNGQCNIAVIWPHTMVM